MYTRDLIDLFIKVADFYDEAVELYGQDGDTDFAEQYMVQHGVVLEIIEYLKTCNNTSLFLPVVLKQLSTQFNLFEIEYLKVFLRDAVTGIEESIQKLEDEKKEYTNITSLIEMNKDFLKTE